MRWLRAHADQHRVDPNWIAIGGVSAGGVTAVAVATTPDDPGSSGNPGQPSHVRAAVPSCGALPPEFEPPDYARRRATLFVHGTRDSVMPIGWARSNQGATAEDGVLAILHEIEGAIAAASSPSSS